MKLETGSGSRRMSHRSSRHRPRHGAQNAPPGAAMSSNLEYVGRTAGAAGITEGKFDRVSRSTTSWS